MGEKPSIPTILGSLVISGAVALAAGFFALPGPVGAQSSAAAPSGPASSGTNTGGGADPATFNNFCRTCHSAKQGDNRLGPSLYKVVGRKAGTAQGYASYSEAMKSSGITWDEQNLDRLITNPDAVVPNNNMKPFKGVPDAAVRKKIIEYLKSAGGSGD